MDLGPNMASCAFNVNDEYFPLRPPFPADEMYSLHSRNGREEFCNAARAWDVKPETERFYTGAGGTGRSFESGTSCKAPSG